jgi:SNF2-related domain
MASPSFADGVNDEGLPPQTGADESLINHQESSETAEGAAMNPASGDAFDNRIVRESSRPKSEEPSPDFSSIPEEIVANDSAHRVGESAVRCAAANDPSGTANSVTANEQGFVPEISRYGIPQTADSASAADENFVGNAQGNNMNPTAISNPTESRTIALKKKLFKTPKERSLEAAQNERRLQEAGELFRQSLIIDSPTLQSATPAKPTLPDVKCDTQIVETGHQSSPIELDTEAEDAAAASRFKSYKRTHERKKKKGWNTVEEDVAFSKARNAEERRLKLKSRKRTYKAIDSEVEVLEDDDPLFISEGTPPALLDASVVMDLENPTAPKRRMPCRPNRISESALHDATQIGFDALEAERRRTASRKRQRKGAVQKKTPKESKTRVSRSKDKKVDMVPQPKRGKGRKGPEMTNLQTLLNNDIVSAAQANAGKAAQPGFTSKNKREALAELIASIPESERTTHNADKNALDKATTSFTGRAAMKADGNNGWRLRGMKTSLYHYQLLGAAFMRDRENSTTRPYGGLQSDEMGLGKTVTCLANIIDGQAPPNSPNRTTLIVCPSALCSQWLGEIRKHVLPGTFQEAIIYRSGGRVESADPTKTLSNMDIIITSYNEVLRSFPHCDTPMHLVTPEARAQWWSENFNANRGVLHQIFFRRIVLDEGKPDFIFSSDG